MGKLIAGTQATIDGVVDPAGEWVQPDGDHGDYSFDRQARPGGLVLGRKTVGSESMSGERRWTRTCSRGPSRSRFRG